MKDLHTGKFVVPQHELVRAFPPPLRGVGQVEGPELGYPAWVAEGGGHEAL